MNMTAPRVFGRRPRRLALAAASAAVAAAVAACAPSVAASGPGSGSQGGGDGITIGKAVDTIGFTAVDVAKAKGYFGKAGPVNENLLSGSSTAFAALQSGSVDFVTASSAALLKAKAKGLPLEAVASMDHGVSLQLLVSQKWIKAHGMTPGQSPGTVAKKLAGAKLGVLSTTDKTYDQYLAKQGGISPDSFTYINISGQSAALAAIQHGEIDAFLLSPPSTYYAQSQGDAKIMASLNEIPSLKNMAYDVLVVDTDWAKSHQSQVAEVAGAIAKADDTMSDDPQAVLATEKQHYPTMPASVLLDSLRHVTFAPGGRFTPAMWTAALDEFKQGGDASPGVDVSASGGAWTNSYLHSAGH